MSAPWTAWLERCSLSGLHAFARENAVEPLREEDESDFRERLVRMSEAGSFDEFRRARGTGGKAAMAERYWWQQLGYFTCLAEWQRRGIRFSWIQGEAFVRVGGIW